MMVKYDEKERVWDSDSLSPPSRLLEGETPPPRSLSERIGVSARGLLQSTILQLPPGAAVEVLASTASTSEKGGSSSGSSRSVVSSEALDSSPVSMSSNQSWRSAAEDHVDYHPVSAPEVYGFTAFAESSGMGSCGTISNIDRDFEVDGKLKHEDRTQLLEHTMRSVLDYGRAAPEFEKADMMSIEVLKHQHAGLDRGHDEAQRTFDGAEVVGLLSDPTFCLDEMPIDVVHGTDLSRQEHKVVSQAGLPRPVSHSDAVANHLHLIPRSGVDPIILEEMAATMPQVDDYAQELDLQPWLQILDSYHDEVWGDMLPLVRQVREELRQSDNKQKVEDKPATRRLQMLIGHLKY